MHTGGAAGVLPLACAGIVLLQEAMRGINIVAHILSALYPHSCIYVVTCLVGNAQGYARGAECTMGRAMQ